MNTSKRQSHGSNAIISILQDVEFVRDIITTLNKKRLARSAERLYNALQNTPLQDVINQAAGRAIDRALISRLEDDATSLVLGELEYLDSIARSISDKYKRVILFRGLIPLMGDTLAFRNGAWEVRSTVVKLLCTVWGKHRIVHVLADIMRLDKNPITPRTVAQELSSMANLESFDVLVDALGSKDTLVREIVTETLENPDHRSLALRTLERGLAGPKPTVRKSAARFLHKLEWNSPSESTLGWYYVADQQWSNAGALGETAFPALENAMKGGGPAIRMQAALILGELGWKPANQVWQGWFLVATQNWAGVDKLRIASRAALVNVLEDEPSPVRDSAGSALESIGEDAVPALVTALKESTTVAVHRTACAILARIAESLLREDQEHAYAILSDAIPALTAVLQIPGSTAIIDTANAVAAIAETVGPHPPTLPLLQGFVAAIGDVNRGLHVVYQQNLDVAQQRILRAIEGRALPPRWRLALPAAKPGLSKE